MDRLKVTEIIDRPTNERLPDAIVAFSGNLEYAVSELLDSIHIQATENGEVPFHAPQNSVGVGYVTYAGGPPVLLPQNPKYHEHDVLTHLDLASVAAFHFEEFVDSYIYTELQPKVLLVLKNNDLTPFAVAAMLHDIEKAFWVSSVSSRHPSDKAENRMVLKLLGAYDCFPPEEGDAKPVLQRFFLTGLPAHKPLEGRLTSMEGFFESHYGELVAKEVTKILEIYAWIDNYFIAHSGDYSSHIQEELVQTFSDFSDKYEQDVAVFGILTMICDNIAQGNPQKRDGDFNFERQREVYINRCNLLLKEVLKKND